MNMIQIWLIEIFGIACAVAIIMSQFKPYAWLVEKVLTFKPFNCEMCMAFWCYLAYSLCNYNFSIETIMNAFICSYIGYLTSTKFLKW